MGENMELKQCSRCHSNILLEHFEKNRQGQLFKTCTNCRQVNRELFNNYREQNREKELEINKQYRQNNLERVREYDRQRDKLRYPKRKEELREYKHKYHQEHREKINAKTKERRQTEEYKERIKQYLLDNKEKLDAKNKERFTCGCGGCYTRHNKTTHEKAKMHLEWLGEQQQTNNE